MLQIVRWCIVGLLVLVGITVWQNMNHAPNAKQNWNRVASKSMTKLRQDARGAERAIQAAKSSFNAQP